MKNAFLLLTVFLFIYTCDEKELEKEENVYQIISVLSESLSAPIPHPFPPLKEGITEEDSLKIEKMVNNYRKKIENQKLIVAVDPYLNPINHIEVRGQELNPELKELISGLESIPNKKPLDISKIKVTQKYKLISFDDTLVEKGKCDFIKFDRRLIFSRIAFNEDLTSAAVIGSTATSCLAGSSSLHFLELRKGKWEIVHTIFLSIS